MKHGHPRIDALLQQLIHPKLATIDLSLDRINGLLAALGNPHDRLPPVVHVAGTNGKGSLLAYLTAILEAAGCRVHRYTSPHLVRFNERIVVAGREIGDTLLLGLLERIADFASSHPVTFFEATTAAAFLAFAQEPADIVLLETGLGGRLDATNTVKRPLLTAITPVSIDHKEYLGDTIAAIAAEKAGILKPNVPCVVGPQVPEAEKVIQSVAIRMGALLYRFSREWQMEEREGGFRYCSAAKDALFPAPNLAGLHQLANAATAIACIEQLAGFTITDAHIRQGITHAQWPARLQRIHTGGLAALLPEGTELWLDGGHNPAAGEVLAQWMKEQAKPVHLICGMLKNKDTAQFLAPLAPHARSLTALAIEEESLSQSPEIIISIAQRLSIPATLAGHAKNGIEAIVKKHGNNSIILICGSLYLAGNILWLNSQSP